MTIKTRKVSLHGVLAKKRFLPYMLHGCSWSIPSLTASVRESGPHVTASQTIPHLWFIQWFIFFTMIIMSGSREGGGGGGAGVPDPGISQAAICDF